MTCYKKNLIQILFLVVSFFQMSCGSTSGTTDETLKLSGTRYKATLTRLAEEKEWVEVQGTHEWWFYGGGVFKQIAVEYVEPQFYADFQACNGEASGSYTTVETAKRMLTVTLKYDGARDVRGACRMESRDLQVVLQPSGAVDGLDGKIVQRLERVETLPQ